MLVFFYMIYMCNKVRDLLIKVDSIGKLLENIYLVFFKNKE